MHSPRWIERKKKCLTLKPGALIANDKWLLFSMRFLVGFYRTFLLIFIWFSSHLFNQIIAAFGQFWMNDVMREVSRLTNNFVEQRTKTLALSKKKYCEDKTFLGAHRTQIQWLCSSNRISFYRRANIVAILMVACTCCELLVLMLVMVLWCCLCRMWIPLFMFFFIVVVVVVGRLLVAHS